MKYAFMKMKRGGSPLALFVALAALVLLICYLLSRQTTSPFASVAQGVSDLFEGFVSTTSPQCPPAVVDVYGNQVSPAYKFFTDATGESLCCAGTINPLTHRCIASTTMLSGGYMSQPNQILPWASRIDITSPPSTLSSYVQSYNSNLNLPSAKALCTALSTCTAFAYMTSTNGGQNSAIFYNSPTSSPIVYSPADATRDRQTAILYVRPLAENGLCAFRPGVPDPNDKTKTLPLCTAVQDNALISNGSNVCPPSLPKYAASSTQKSCCKTATNLDGTDCIATDLQNKTFCRVSPSNGDPNCATMKSYETAVCPAPLQKISYTLGPAESSAYPAANGLQAPLCFGIQGSCFPDNTVADLRTKNVFTREPNPNDPVGSKLWKYACGGYTKLMSGDSSNIQMNYVTQSSTGLF